MKWIIALAIVTTSHIAFSRQVQGEFLVKLKGNSFTKASQNLFLKSGLRTEKVFDLVPGLVKVSMVNGLSASETLSNLQKSSEIEYVVPNYLRTVTMVSERVPSQDSFLADPAIPPYTPPPAKWIADPKLYSNFGVAQNRTLEVFEKYKFYGDKKVIIAVIDTGVDYTHKDLASNMWRNAGESGTDGNGNSKETNGIDDDGNGYVDDVVGYDFVNKDSLPYDDYSHGTHVAGIAAAVAGNGFGIAGQCPKCSVMGLKFISADGWGSDADAISALEYAVKNGATVINSSWGSPEDSPALKDAFFATDKAGVLNAIAAGNEGDDITFKHFYPANYELPGGASVAALYDVNIMVPWWSNYSWWFVSLSAAGAEVFSTIPGGRFASYSGTSMASPNVAGMLGLIKSYKPKLTQAQIKGLFKEVMPDRDSMNKVHFGGRLDMIRIFDKLQGM